MPPICVAGLRNVAMSGRLLRGLREAATPSLPLRRTGWVKICGSFTKYSFGPFRRRGSPFNSGRGQGVDIIEIILALIRTAVNYLTEASA